MVSLRGNSRLRIQEGVLDVLDLSLPTYVHMYAQYQLVDNDVMSELVLCSCRVIT